MAEAATLEKLRQRRIERMRMGQETAEPVSLPSDSEMRIALVPLTEKEYDEAQRAVAAIAVEGVPENIPGAQVLDRQEKREVLVRAIREPDDYSSRVFQSVAQMLEVLEPVDINVLYDKFIDMAIDIAPDIRAMTDEEIDFLKRVFESLNWSDLSGRQQLVLNRFLSSLSPEQLLGKSPGSFSII